MRKNVNYRGSAPKSTYIHLEGRWVSKATRIWGESGLCLQSTVWHFHLTLVPVSEKQKTADLGTLV